MKSAKGLTACEKELGRLVDDLQKASKSTDDEGYPTGRFAIVERGGHFESFADRSGIVELLKPIDTAEEAHLVIQTAFGLSTRVCNSLEESAFRVF